MPTIAPRAGPAAAGLSLPPPLAWSRPMPSLPRPAACLMTALALVVAMSAVGCGSSRPEGPRRLSPAAENRLRAERFFAENRGRPDVVTLPSGLQYRVLKAGDGAIPGPRDTVVLHYRGRFLDGREFQTSRDRGDLPAQLRITDLIRGWREALTMMPVGSTWELFVPSPLAYGLDGKPPTIGPNQALIFEIELIDIAGR